jgi:hypothetical protein
MKTPFTIRLRGPPRARRGFFYRNDFEEAPVFPANLRNARLVSVLERNGNDRIGALTGIRTGVILAIRKLAQENHK